MDGAEYPATVRPGARDSGLFWRAPTAARDRERDRLFCSVLEFGPGSRADIPHPTVAQHARQEAGPDLNYGLRFLFDVVASFNAQAARAKAKWACPARKPEGRPAVRGVGHVPHVHTWRRGGPAPPRPPGREL